jgi:hypothetical protein
MGKNGGRAQKMAKKRVDVLGKNGRTLNRLREIIRPGQ